MTVLCSTNRVLVEGKGNRPAEARRKPAQFDSRMPELVGDKEKVFLPDAARQFARTGLWTSEPEVIDSLGRLSSLAGLMNGQAGFSLNPSFASSSSIFWSSIFLYKISGSLILWPGLTG